MNAISAFLMQNIVFVYFFCGLAFFSIGLVVTLESTRASEFRFARALRPLALFGFVHGGHEWFEMFQVFAAHEGAYTSSVPQEVVRVVLLGASFLILLDFGTRLLPDAERWPRANIWQVAVLALFWLSAIAFVYWRFRPPLLDLLIAADVLARYSLGIPGALLAAWALLRERLDFHARGMSAYGQDLLWAALAFFIYGALGQLFTRPSLVFPSQTVNTALFLRTFGLPVQMLRGLAGAALAMTLAHALRAFEQESRLRLARANAARLEAQAAALEAQQHRADEIEALNVQLRATTRELSALVEMSRILTSTLDLGELIGKALYQVVHSVKASCCSMVFLKQPDDSLSLIHEYRRPGMGRLEALPPFEALVGKAISAGRPAGATLDYTVRELTPNDFVDGIVYRSLCAPLHAKGQLFGGLVLTSLDEDVSLGPKELELLNAFAQQIATSIDNLRLYQIVREREAQLAELVRQLVNAQEGERQRIARELHDETGQKLTALGMGLAAVETHLDRDDRTAAAALIGNLREVADHAIAELHNVMANLRPSQLDDLGLAPALRWYVQQFAARHPALNIQLKADRLPERLPSQYETILFRVAQEALTNVIRHAHAANVMVTLSQQGDAVRLEVRDDGVGFDVAAPTPRGRGGWGLVGIRERVAAVPGGQCEIDSRPGQGACIRVGLPVTQME